MKIANGEQIFRSEIPIVKALDYLSRSSEKFGNFPVGNTKIASIYISNRDFRSFFVNGKQPISRCSLAEHGTGLFENPCCTCSRLIFQPIKFLICGVVVDIVEAKVLSNVSYEL